MYIYVYICIYIHTYIGIAVECGAGLTSSVPVFEGLALAHAAVHVEYGGQDITRSLRAKFNEFNFHINHFDTKVLKEKHCFVGTGGPGTGGGPESEMEKFYLPDGEEVCISRSVFSDCLNELIDDGTGVLPPGSGTGSVGDSHSRGGIVNQVRISMNIYKFIGLCICLYKYMCIYIH
jgi:hypothetical protein